MAEIKSTLEKVMEKLAEMDAASDGGDEFDSEEKIKDGMRLGARFLRGEVSGLDQVLDDYSEADRPLIMKGVARTMLRNIVLPREAGKQKESEMAMQGLLEISRGSSRMVDVCTDMKQNLDRYLDNKEQYRKQLESAFLSQMEMMEGSVAQQTGMSIKLEPSQHPKFQEEWMKVVTGLNDQYSNVLEQQKAMVEQLLIL
ncbi:MAG: hypothetical protein KAI90_05250 [Desulfobulbaceae bacterium]|nr:hypothetical protein [Desulfobulbaceae bacterium]